MTRQTSDQTPIWCGIHYLLYLRQPGEEQDCARFSLFQTEYSPAGSGCAAFLYIDPACFAPAPVNAVYADNPELAAWLYSRMYRGRDNPLADCGEPVISARFGRSGDMRRQMSYSIDTAQGQVSATWAGLETPLFTMARAGLQASTPTASLLLPRAPALMIDGEVVPGDIYPRQDWIPLVGRPLSSCLIGDEFWATHSVSVGDEFNDEKAAICPSRCFVNACQHVSRHADAAAG